MKKNRLGVPKRIQNTPSVFCPLGVVFWVERLDELIGKRKKMDEARPVGPETDGRMDPCTKVTPFFGVEPKGLYTALSE